MVNLQQVLLNEDNKESFSLNYEVPLDENDMPLRGEDGKPLPKKSEKTFSTLYLVIRRALLESNGEEDLAVIEARYDLFKKLGGAESKSVDLTEDEKDLILGLVKYTSPPLFSAQVIKAFKK